MLSLISKSRANQLFLFIMTLFVVIGYAWLGAKVFEPELRIPSGVVAQAVFFEKGEMSNWDSAKGSRSRELTFFVNELHSASSYFDSIGKMKNAVDLVINVDDPLRYVMTESQIELGLDVARSEGELFKAVIKAWLLQNARPEISGSLLRTEVVSDVLLALARGQMELRFPGEEPALEFVKQAKWPSALTSFLRYCESPWRSC